MLSATPSKSNRRSTRAGRYSSGRRGGGGDEQPSWRPSEKAARKWIQVKRPPAPGARFFIPTWVPVDELTPEEEVEYRSQIAEESPAPSGTGDIEMASADASKGELKSDESPRVTLKGSGVAEETVPTNSSMTGTDLAISVETNEIVNAEQAPSVDASEEASTTTTEVYQSIYTEVETGGATKVEVAIESKTVAADTSTDAEASKPGDMNPFELLVNTTSNAQVASVSASADGEMADADPNKDDKQPSYTVAPSDAPNTLEGDSKSTPTKFSPLNLSRETSVGMPGFDINSKALKSRDSFEDDRPHNPVADILQDPAAAAPSRPVSEPSAMLMEGPANSLFGESVMHPVPVAYKARDNSPTDPPTAARKDSVHFAHSDSDSTPFHAPITCGSKDENETKDEPTTDTPNVNDEPVSERERKRPRLED
jgi:hypothetical protein